MDKENNKALVVYYSETGTTEAIAKKISQATGADLYRIEPEQPYSAADLDWQDDNSRSTKEMNDRTARPAIKNGKVNLDSINTVRQKNHNFLHIRRNFDRRKCASTQSRLSRTRLR